MTIGIEAERANLAQKTGVEHYAKQLILHLAKIDLQNNYILYLRTRPEAWFSELPKNFQVKVMPFPIFWTQLRLSWEMLINPVDVLFIPASALPVIHPKKSVVTIHDLAWKYFPETFTWFLKNFLEASTKFALSHANKIIAVSESTKKDILKFYKVDKSKTIVIHHGYELKSGQAARDKRQETRDKGLQMPEKYVLFLSTLQPRKNLKKLIEAFRLLKSQNSELPHKLVVAGKMGWKFESILKKIEENKDIVVYLNHVSDAEKSAVLASADLLVVPSLYEGFGMQILEAFAANVPVAASNISSMPEVAGDAAVYFDPNNIQDMAQSLKIILTDKSLSQKLCERGKIRLNNFSWEKCAQETLKVLLS